MAKSIWLQQAKRAHLCSCPDVQGRSCCTAHSWLDVSAGYAVLYTPHRTVSSECQSCACGVLLRNRHDEGLGAYHAPDTQCMHPHVVGLSRVLVYRRALTVCLWQLGMVTGTGLM